jgi:hypothetical protein
MATRPDITKLSRWRRLTITVITLTLLLPASACLPKPQPTPTPQPSQPPVIQSVIAENTGTSATEYKVTCLVTAPQSNVLSYQWSTDNGTIEGVGNTITWVVPEAAGYYTVKVTVKDEKGGVAVGSTTITVNAPVKPNQPPTITSLTCDLPKNRLRIWYTTTITCVAEDPDGDQLHYIWSATGGKVQGEGNKVGWTAPGVKGTYTVDVKVTDDKGGEAQGSIAFDVFCCGN